MRISALLLLATLPAVPAAEARPDFQSAQIIQTEPVQFPVGLYNTFKRGGNASIDISIDAEGRLTDWLVVSYTDRVFANLALSALKHWQYKPAVWEGQPAAVCTLVKFTFDVRGVILTKGGDDEAGDIRYPFTPLPQAYRPYSVRELDRAPVAVQAGSPSYPPFLAEKGVGGEVTIQFYIDERGRVRMPSALGRPQPDLAGLALTAVDHWRFQPPTRNGHAVLAHVTEVFRFEPRSSARSG